MPVIFVTQLEAAHRQLGTAIELWIDDADPVSTHTLAFAAHQIIHDINRERKGPPLLIDMPDIRPEMRQEFVNIVKRAPNFFKHADGRKRHKPPKKLEFDSDANMPLLAFSIIGLKALGEKLSPHEVAFNAVLWVLRPDIHMADARLAQQSIHVELAHLRKQSKRYLFNQFLRVVPP